MARTLKSVHPKKPYISPSQLTLMSFETPFSEHLDASNRWVRLAIEIPWDSIVNVYLSKLNNHATGASNINPRVILGALMVKHMQNISDEETIQLIRENVYIQYFLGFDSFTSKAPFDSSLFVEIRKRVGMVQLNRINDLTWVLACGGTGGHDLLQLQESAHAKGFGHKVAGQAVGKAIGKEPCEIESR
jgi:IS5 family transposase